MRSALFLEATLQFLDFNKQFVNTTDTSNEATECVLCQSYNAQELQIAYWSRQLNGAKRKYSTIHKELLEPCKPAGAMPTEGDLFWSLTMLLSR